MHSKRDQLLEALMLRASRIEFVVLVEHLERLFGDVPRVGTAARVHEEAVRFRHDPSLVFHSSDVTRMVRLPSGRYEITANFLGVTGSVSPLATYFTEDLLRAESQDAGLLGEFYDLFHHRLLALFYRAKQRGRPAFARAPTGSDTSTRRALALTGLSSQRLDPPVAPLLLLGRSRIFAMRPRSRAALEAALHLGFPGLPTRLVDFVPRAIQLAEPQRMRLGMHNHQLGRDARLGRRLTGPADALRIEVGPVDRATFERFLPGAPARQRLQRLVDDISGGLLDAEIEIELKPGEELRTRLGSTSGPAATLGRDALIRRVTATSPLRVRSDLADGSGGRMQPSG